MWHFSAQRAPERWLTVPRRRRERAESVGRLTRLVTEAASLYRRHRPRAFDDVVGQEAVVRTLRNAVQQDKVHHAYLFVGSRGTGKTSMAKILAACLNCEQGPTVTPDGTCDSCRSIAAATSLDVIELDAASNNSVDDIRSLRERVAYAPVSGRHKVYILDEAHMLSTSAWNAFLKTLEEPPPNTIFVLATTEAQKVLPTVADRCHRFDFARPSAAQIATVLRRAAAAEQIDLPEAACALIARRAGGSFRDALGDLEQVVTYSGQGSEGQVRIELDAVLAVLNLPDAELLFDASAAVAGADPAAALRAVAALADGGRDAGQFVRDLEEHARALLVVQALNEVPAELAVTPDQDARLVERAQELGRVQVVALLDLLAAAIEAIKAGADARTQLELALMKAAAPELDPSARALLARVERLESQLGSKSPAAAPPVKSAAPAPVPSPSSPSEAAPPSAPPATAAMAAVAEAPAVAVPEPEPSPTQAAVDLESIVSLWPAVIESVRAAHAMLAALLEGARPAGLEGDELRVAFPESAAFLKRKAETAEHRAVVREALATVTGRRLVLTYELAATDEPVAGGGAPVISGEELVARVMAEFDAQELIDEEPLAPAARQESG
jgi:DNA polymerase III subunit gamma/tau